MSEEEQATNKTTTEETDVKPHEIHGGRNLMILGIGAIIIAIITTSISLTIYRITGDIYLDRSRPGYISESEESPKDYESKETFSSEGEVTSKTVDEYLKEFESVKGRIDSLTDSFVEDSLSDDALAIYPRDDAYPAEAE